MKDHYLITGATGFIGSCLTRKLVELGHNVSILTRGEKVNWRLHDITSKLDVHVADLTDPTLPEIVSKIKPTIIFHLATYGAMPNEDVVDKMVDVNIKGTLNLIRAVKRISFKLFINTGSSSEYGMKALPMRETDILEPINDYGVSKATVSLFCQKIARIESLPIITFRLFSPYGQFESKERFVPTVISHMLKNKPLELSSPLFVRDFIFIQDVVDAYLRAVDKNIPFGSIINIGSGKQHTLADVVDVVRERTNSPSHVAWSIQKTQSRQIEPTCWQANIELAHNLLKWGPKYSLKTGIKKTIQWMKENDRYYA